VGCTCAQAAARAPMPAGSHRRQPAPGAGASAGGGAAACCLPCAGSGTVPAVADGSTCALAPLPPNGAGAGSGAAGARGAGAELGSCVAPRSVSTRHAVSSVCTGGHCTRGNAAAHYVFLVPLALETLNDGSFVALRHLNSSKVAAPALVGLKVERPARRARIGVSLNSRKTWLAVRRRGVRAARYSSTAAPAAGAHSNGLSAAMLHLPAAPALFGCQVAARSWRCELATRGGTSGSKEGREGFPTREGIRMASRLRRVLCEMMASLCLPC
jgi:hypothetical protein